MGDAVRQSKRPVAEQRRARRTIVQVLHRPTCGTKLGVDAAPTNAAGIGDGPPLGRLAHARYRGTDSQWIAKR